MGEFFGTSHLYPINVIGDSEWIIGIRSIDRSNGVIKTCSHCARRLDLGTKVNGEREDAVVKGGGGVSDDGEVLKIVLRLFDEAGPLIATNRRKIATLYRCSPVSEPLEHCIKIKFVGHGPTLDQRRPRSSRVTNGSGRNASANIGLTGPTGPVVSGIPPEPLALSSPFGVPPGRVACQ